MFDPKDEPKQEEYDNDIGPNSPYNDDDIQLSEGRGGGC